MKYLIMACSAIFVLVTVLVIRSSYENYLAWEAFKKQHNCVLVEEMQGTTSTGFSSSGAVVTVQTPSKECWECDDGKRYWRNH